MAKMVPEEKMFAQADPNEPRSEALFDHGVIWDEVAVVKYEVEETYSDPERKSLPEAVKVAEAVPVPSLMAEETYKSRNAFPKAPMSAALLDQGVMRVVETDPRYAVEEA